jgi:hypothetical protein
VNVVSKGTPRPKRVHFLPEGSRRTKCNLPWYAVRAQTEYDTTKPCAVCFEEMLELHTLRRERSLFYAEVREFDQKLEKARTDLEKMTLLWETERLWRLEDEEAPIKLRMRRRFWPLVRKVIK